VGRELTWAAVRERGERERVEREREARERGVRREPYLGGRQVVHCDLHVLPHATLPHGR
jgi:hypothetical protein